jgi:hypothetical protein
MEKKSIFSQGVVVNNEIFLSGNCLSEKKTKNINSISFASSKYYKNVNQSFGDFINRRITKRW